MTPGARPVAGAAVVCLRADAVLLVRRAQPPNAGRWSFPGGKIEPGETARQAAEREAWEETGLRVRALEVVDVFDAIFPPYHYCVVDYLAECVDAAAEPAAADDVDEARWVSYTDLEAHDLTEAVRLVLARARWMQEVRGAVPRALGLAPEAPLDRSALRTRLAGIYVVTDATLIPGRGHAEVARAALAGGAAVIQLRDKQADAGVLLPLAREIGALCRASGALFIVNDRVDLALAADADGVHLGQTDLPIREARRLLGPGRLIGISVEDEQQVRAAQAAGADYLGVGAIYGSATKLDAGAPVGLEQIRRLRTVSHLPLVAIGGITRDRLPAVREAGADMAAVVGAVAAAPDPETVARDLVRTWGATC